MKKLTQIQLLREFSENATKKIIAKFSNDSSEEEIRKELQDFEKYKNGIQLKDPFQYKTWLDFTQAIHGAKGKAEFKNRNLKDKGKPKTFVNKSEESSDAIVDDENVTIFKGDEEHKCVKYGSGYSFCISRPGGGNMFGSYRLQKASTFYFIYFKNVPKSDPKHIMVLDRTNKGWEWTFGDNHTQEINGGFDEVVQKFPVLKKYEELFQNNPLTDKEKYELNEIIGFANYQNLQKFNSYDYSLKNKIVKSGILLNDDIFKTLDKNLRNEYISVGGNLTKYQADNLSDSEIARYRKVRKSTIPEYIKLTKYKPSKLDYNLSDHVIFDGLNGSLNYKDFNGNEKKYGETENVVYSKEVDTKKNSYTESFYGENGDILYTLYHGPDYFIKYDANSNKIYSKDHNQEKWYDYDNDNNLIRVRSSDNSESHYNKYRLPTYLKDSNGYETYYNYDDNNMLRHYKNSSSGEEFWFDDNGDEIPNPNIKTESLNINIKRQFTQLDLISESFWSNFKKPFKAVGGLAGAAVKGTAKALDYVAPELTQPLHRLEAGVRDIGNAARTGYDAGSGGLMKVYKDKLLDAGYILDEDKGITKSGKNRVVIGYRIAGHDDKGPIPDKKAISFIFDKNNNPSIINTSTRDTTGLSRTKPPIHGKSKQKTLKRTI